MLSSRVDCAIAPSRGGKKILEKGPPLKGHLLAGAAIVALVAAGSALAADLPLKAPPPAVAAWNWSGLYIGGPRGGRCGRGALFTFHHPLFPRRCSGRTPSTLPPRKFS